MRSPPSAESTGGEIIERALIELEKIVTKGGPHPLDYPTLDNLWDLFFAEDKFELARDIMGDSLSSPETLQGFVYNQPHGYAGDFEIIERIYRGWTTPVLSSRPWDLYFHQTAAARAVRNRKSIFLTSIEDALRRRPSGEVRVLNVGSGPAIDVAEIEPGDDTSRLYIDCIDIDEKALARAEEVTKGSPAKLSFQKANALRFRPQISYDLIWSAGLMDYFDDRRFVFFLERMLGATRENGEIVLGNFGPGNSSRSYMELGRWRLIHRSRPELVLLAVKAGADPSAIRVSAEIEMVNLFLRIQSVHN